MQVVLQVVKHKNFTRGITIVCKSSRPGYDYDNAGNSPNKILHGVTTQVLVSRRTTVQQLDSGVAWIKLDRNYRDPHRRNDPNVQSYNGCDPLWGSTTCALRVVSGGGIFECNFGCYLCHVSESFLLRREIGDRATKNGIVGALSPSRGHVVVREREGDDGHSRR